MSPPAATNVVDETGVVVEYSAARAPAGAPPPLPGPAARPASVQRLEEMRREGKQKQERKAERRARGNPKRSGAKRSRRPRRRLTPWVLLLLTLTGAGVAGMYFWEKYGMMADELAAERAELERTRDRAAALDQEVRSQTADIERARQSEEKAEAAAAARARQAGELETSLEGVLGKGGAELARGAGQLALHLDGRVLFPEGQARLTPRGEDLLDRVGAVLKGLPNAQLRVRGYADDVPMTDSERVYATNWELSSARAIAVVHYLVDIGGLDPSRLAAVAFSEYRAPKGEAGNRRVEIAFTGGPAPAD